MIGALLGSNRARVAFATLALLLIGLGVSFFGKGLYLVTKAEVAQVLMELSFEKTLKDGKPHKPWSWADMWPVAKLSFDTPKKEILVLDKPSGQALAFGPGLLPGGPTLGEPGTNIIAAHNDTHFAFLERVLRGDRFHLQTQTGEKLFFEVVGFEIIDTRKPLNLPNFEFSTLILSTCYPFKSLATQTPFRYLVVARQIQN